MKKLFKNEKTLYLLFGIGTTAVYFLTRFLIVNITENSMWAVITAQITAILFAYFTNKIFVFKDQKWKPIDLLKQITGFIAGRAFVFGLDLLITYIAVVAYSKEIIHFLGLNSINYDHLLFSSSLTKGFIGTPALLNEFIFVFIVQILAIIINYIISKKAVFKAERVNKEQLH